VALKDTAAQTVTDERGLAVQLFNDTWVLLEKENRTPEEDDRNSGSRRTGAFHARRCLSYASRPGADD
jgi:hypothetical protein